MKSITATGRRHDFRGQHDFQRREVALYVFFYPLTKDAENKIRHICCDADFFIKGQVVPGFDRPVIDTLLKD